MARPKIVIDGYWRSKIEQWAKDGARRDEIAQRLHDQANIKIGASTLSTQLRAWGIRYNNTPIKKTDALRDRVKDLFHSRPGLRDEETLRILRAEGFQISGTRALARLRKEGGLYKRVERSQEEKIQEDIKDALRKEFGDNFELPEDLTTRGLSVYLRSKYNLVGRDRVRRIAAELNPKWVQRRKEKGRFPRTQPETPRQAAEDRSSITDARSESQSPAQDVCKMEIDTFADLSRLTELSRTVETNQHLQPVEAEPAGSSRTVWLDPSLMEPA